MRRNPERPKFNAANWEIATERELAEAQDQWRELALSGELDLSKALLWNAQLPGANLERVNFRNALMSDCNLKGANLEKAKLPRVWASSVNFQGANLMGASLHSAILDNSKFQGANLLGVNFDGASLDGVNFQGANLIGTTIPLTLIAPSTGTGWQERTQELILPRYFKSLKAVDLTTLGAVILTKKTTDGFFELRKFFRDRGQDEFGELIECEIRLDMAQVQS
jgi:hypothetical protein